MKIVTIIACPSGVAHTYLAAESLIIAAKKNNVEIKVETQGSIGIENELTVKNIEEATVVILTNDIGIKNEERFKGKPIVRIEYRIRLKYQYINVRTYIKKILINQYGGVLK